MTTSSRDLISVPLTAALFRGAAEIETTGHGVTVHRLPSRARAQNTDPQLAMVEAQPSGVHLALRTTASTIELEVLRSRTTYTGIPPRPDGMIEIVVDDAPVASATTSGGITVTIDMSTGARFVEEGPSSTARFTGLPDAPKDVEIWLPHNEAIELIDVRADAPVEPTPDRGRKRWIHHGSSISQGSNAVRPTGTWPAVAARRASVELINLGLGGSALLDPFVARTIRDAAADVISLKLGINLVNTDLMRMRAFGPAVHGFLDTIRDGHPTTPLLVVSPVYCGIHEDTPGPGAFDPDALAHGAVRFQATGDPAERSVGKLTLTTIRGELARIVRDRRRTDSHLHYLDGLSLYDQADAATHPLPDALHPDAATHQMIGERFARVLSDLPA
ncbi:SGNH/GDSL hydrolase family protein [Streptosporangium sp. NPDC000509]|uniref:SGNH/GDSL hydrolase family protein n=1 Tax=Streptosporangium sp. NPDC000509 TaxID=3366186 RepID=UPI00369D375D